MTVQETTWFFGDSETGGEVTVDFTPTPQFGAVLGRSYTITLAVDDNTDYLTVQNLARFAEAHANFGTGNNGRPWFSETLPSDAQVESVVAPLEPGAGLRTRFGSVVRGIWGIVDDLSIASTPEGEDRHIMDVDLFALGYVDSAGGSSDPDFYASRSEVETALGQPYEVESV